MNVERGRGARRGRPTTRRTRDIPTNANLIEMIANLQRQLQSQQSEINELRANNNRRETHDEPTPITPQHQERVVEAPTVHATVRSISQEPLLVRWKRVKPTDFEGSSDPLVAQAWLKTIEATLKLMGFTENEQVLCASYCLTMEARVWWEGIEQSRDVNRMTWADFLKEFNEKFFHMNITRKHYDEFEGLRQGDMTVIDVVTKFDQLARLCPGMVRDEEVRVRRLIKVLRPEIAVIVDGASPPNTQAELVKGALHAEYHLQKNKKYQPPQNQSNNEADSQSKAQGNNNNNQNWRNNKRKGNFKNQKNHGSRKEVKGPQQYNNNKIILPCNKCGKKHLGKCRWGTNQCYSCGREGHISKDCPTNTNTQNQRKTPITQLHNMQTTLEGPLITQGRLEVAPANARI
ncbi:hypothetical protein DH2020_020244 [Rehmannia glutinosa]|uniref:CCHC-type domain-containing protein n=1 Tax=Rehmannia glutinosa TaxID=99300 RepID=A0ABR0WGU5_REHGL